MFNRRLGPADGSTVEPNLNDCDRSLLDAVLAQSCAAVFIADGLGQCLSVNDRWCEIAGCDPAGAKGDGWIEALHPEDRADVVGSWWACVAAGERFEQRFRFRRPDGTDRPVRGSAAPVRDESGTVHMWVGAVEACSEPARPAPLDADAAVLAAAAANSSDLLVVIDEGAVLTYVSSASERMLGLRPDEWVGRNVLELLHPDDSIAAVESLVTSVDSGVRVKGPLEVRVRHADGGWHEVEIFANNLLDEPAVGGILLNVRDVSERRQAQRREKRAKGRFEQAFDQSPIGMALTNIEGRYERVNRALCDLLGLSASELLASSVLELTHPDDLPATVAAAVELLEGRDESFSFDKRLLAEGGRPVWTRATTTLMCDDDGRPQHFLTQVEDIEERRQLIEELRQSALRDPLTGLANRAGLEEHLEGLARGTVIGVIALDLDEFKQVNDTSGHAAGDEVLRSVAARIRSSVRPVDHSARTGGDEFVVVIASPCSAAELSLIAERLTGRISEEIVVGESLLSVSASVGVAIGAVEESDVVLQRADEASYAAKRTGGNDVAVSPDRHD